MTSHIENTTFLFRVYQKKKRKERPPLGHGNNTHFRIYNNGHPPLVHDHKHAEVVVVVVVVSLFLTVLIFTKCRKDDR